MPASVAYNNGEGGVTDRAVFLNTYRAETTYGQGAALNVAKTLNGRALSAG